MTVWKCIRNKQQERERAEALYEYLIEKYKQNNLFISKGVFRESMLVELVNDEPVTILLDSKKIY